MMNAQVLSRKLMANERFDLQAYLLKKPGNFAQHYLANACSHAKMEVRYPTKHPIKELPTNFLSKKIKFRRDRPFPHINHFFFAARGDAPLENKRRGDSRAERKFWP